jgi:hypothetical protein
VNWGHIGSIFRNWYHQKMMFFQILFDYQIFFSLLIKKQPFINFLPKKQRIYDYFSEFASEALHIVIFENFVKSMTSCLSKLKVTPSFCFAFKIHDDVTATNKYHISDIYVLKCWLDLSYNSSVILDFSLFWNCKLQVWCKFKTRKKINDYPWLISHINVTWLFLVLKLDRNWEQCLVWI